MSWIFRGIIDLKTLLSITFVYFYENSQFKWIIRIFWKKLTFSNTDDNIRTQLVPSIGRWLIRTQMTRIKRINTDQFIFQNKSVPICSISVISRYSPRSGLAGTSCVPKCHQCSNRFYLCSNPFYLCPSVTSVSSVFQFLSVSICNICVISVPICHPCSQVSSLFQYQHPTTSIVLPL